MSPPEVDQQAFVGAVLDAARGVPEGLVDPEGRPAGRRFSVYRNNVAVSLTEALATAFPVIQKLIGEENFKAVAGVFLRRYPPDSPLMMFYGQQMPVFLERFEPLQHLGYLPDVARLEIALRESYHAADAAPFDPQSLQVLPADRLMAARLRLAPALRLVRSRWPVASIWHFNRTEGAPKPPATGENALITRPGFDPQITALPPGGGAFLASLMAGESFGTALDAASTAVDGFDLTPVLGLLIQGEAITAIEEGSPA
ncbi:DUF2063 domain-containing protein [Pseudoruegeria sp. SHC-113]|uniref:HvfC/BufC N-terminal domain-containing protein n=1 Tax=Pseudoruegeria sp. SHC-113 TaxID=2855439 RepID=UPI0021BB7164|nr:DNA-binding domain-containing protein [Pseudoruegeria sp. SHC-113]MCT8159770.1 DNA-binding domain-containing protein [Pseudoruegeria sp. SHC-113]